MKCDELETEMWLDYGGEPMPCYPAKDVDAAIDELKEVAKDACLERDDNQNVIDELNAENRRLKRALYKACANWAKVTKIWDGSRPADDFDKWFKVERKCRAKAEQYK